MFSTFPSTPRSRFSKALPVIPGQSTTEFEAVNPKPTMSVKSDLPPLPVGASNPPNLIPRRPVGAPNQLPKSPSVESLSSVYSDSPGLSRSHSNSSTKESLSITDSEDHLPSPPTQDKEEKQTTNVLDSPSSFNGSPTQTELWKRRSIRSERTIQVSELKLTVSNGSTASPPRRQEPTPDLPLPRSLTGRKPIPARPAPPQPDFRMGNAPGKLVGKLENKLRKKLSSSKDTVSQDEAHPQQPSPSKQPPTPEYLNTDKPQPATPQVLSPNSPFTPPQDTAPQLPPKAEARTNQNIKPAMLDTEIPHLLSHSRESSDTLTITSEAPVMRSPRPQKSFGARILTPQPSPEKVTSPHNLGSPAAHSSFFPTIPSPATPGTIFPGPSLETAHFECYQSHKYMRSSRNGYCPVGCMVCLKKDTETRWRCTWCCLSACGSCMQVLSSVPGKDLRTCLDRLGHRR